jgi:hypothetical protein
VLLNKASFLIGQLVDSLVYKLKFLILFFAVSVLKVAAIPIC